MWEPSDQPAKRFRPPEGGAGPSTVSPWATVTVFHTVSSDINSPVGIEFTNSSVYSFRSHPAYRVMAALTPFEKSQAA